MIESNKTYKSLSTLTLAFKASPICTALYVLLAFIQALLPTAVMAIVTANFVDTATAILSGARSHNEIYLPLILLLVVMGVLTNLGIVNQLLSSRINLSLQRKLKLELIGLHAALEYKHIENAESWEIISRVSRAPVESVMSGFSAYMQLMQIIVSIVSILGLIVARAWLAAVIIVVFSVPMFWLSMRAGKKNYQAGRDVEKFNRRTDYLNEVLIGREGIDERTLFGFGKDVSKRWKEQYEAGRILQLKVTAKMFMITKGSSLILALIAIFITVTLIEPVIAGQMSAGMFMGIVTAVFSMIAMLGWQMSFSLESISRAGEYMKDLTAFCGLSKAEGATDLPDAEPIAVQSLEFRNVSFKYHGGNHYILKGLSFSLQGGRHYAFVGRNGAGKTTITKLLTGLYPEYEGEILINGKELKSYSAGTLKALFSVVYQDYAKYYISLRDNIMLGDVVSPDANNRVPATLKLAGLDDVVRELKEGIDTPLGKIKDRGQDISGGQWQRVAIARSLNSRAPVKILDEPTAALDPISEGRVYEEFRKLMLDKMTVFISHRLSSTRLADEILVIDGGKVAECGTHSKLMEAGGQYAQMFESQRSWYQ